MRATLEIQEPRNIELKMTINATLSEWQQISQQLQENNDRWNSVCNRLSRAIDRSVMNITKEFVGESEVIDD